MTGQLEPRISNAVFDDESREFMFILNHYLLHIVSRGQMDIQVRSNLPFDVVFLADEWISEVSVAIAEQNNVKPNLIRTLIHDSL